MGDGTGIEWTDATWNPIRGCSMVSAGCTNCYAMGVAKRFSGKGLPYEGLVREDGKWNGTVRLVPEHLEDPLRWKRPRRIFVNSMSDLFHESLSNEMIAAIFGVMAAAPQHTFQVLTKRPKRMVEWFAWLRDDRALDFCACRADDALAHLPRSGRAWWFAPGRGAQAWPLPNVWLGVSVENQTAADERIPLLLETPAALRFVSCEPLLGPVNLERVQWPGRHAVDVLRGGAWEFGGLPGFTQHSDMNKIAWVIAGGESGPGARPMYAKWARSLRDQCAAADTALFFKQWGEWAPGEGTSRLAPSNGMEFDDAMRRVGKRVAGSLLDGKEHKEFPS